MYICVQRFRGIHFSFMPYETQKAAHFSLFNSFYLPINLIPDCFLFCLCLFFFFLFHSSVSFMLISCVLHIRVYDVRFCLCWWLQLCEYKIYIGRQLCVKVYSCFHVYVGVCVCLHMLNADLHQPIYLSMDEQKQKGCLLPINHHNRHAFPMIHFYVCICNLRIDSIMI